jgi:hypothetical protein
MLTETPTRSTLLRTPPMTPDMVGGEAGGYAHDRYKRALRRYRRRMRRYTVAFLASSFGIYLALALTIGVEFWSFATGMLCGALVFMAFWVHDEPPETIAKWARGADGERRTAKAIKPLLKEGWKVRHDIDLGRGNADHVLLSPKRTVYLLETKTLAGEITVNRGVIVCRSPDDPDETRRLDPRHQVTQTARQLSGEWSRRTGRPAPGIQPVVVIWGATARDVSSFDGIHYVSGTRLERFLRDAVTES